MQTNKTQRKMENKGTPTLSDIVNSLPLSFKYGDPDTLKKMMLKDDNDFLRFRGRDQFDKKVKAIYPNINIYTLYEDFIINLRICYSIRRFCENYYHHGNSEIIRFRYDDSMDENTGKYFETEFKILNGVTRPIFDDFWNTFLPPNYVGDRCFISQSYKDEITPIPLNLPQVNKRFVYDLKGLFLSKITPKPPVKFSESNSVDLLKSFGIDLDKIILNSAASANLNANEIILFDDNVKTLKK